MNLLEQQEIMLKLTGKSDSPASKYHRWFKENAIHFTKVDKKQSIDLAKKYGSEVKQCYANCGRALMNGSNLKYYEGNVNFHGIPIQHAWLADGDQVVDITLGIDPKIRKRRAKKHGIDLKETVNEFGVEYYGVEIPKDDLMKLIFKTKKFGDHLIRYWESKN